MVPCPTWCRAPRRCELDGDVVGDGLALVDLLYLADVPHVVGRSEPARDLVAHLEGVWQGPGLQYTNYGRFGHPAPRYTMR